MKRLVRTLAACSVLAIASACGWQSGDDGATHVEGRGEPPHVVTVAVHQTGGLKPTDQMVVFSEGAPPPAGYTARDVDAVLARADALAASAVTTPRLPQTPCCDLYSYDITLTFSDGDSVHYATSDGVRHPKPLEDLLSAIS